MGSIGDHAKSRAALLSRSDYIDPALYRKYGVKSGLRNEDGKGVLAGLTTISQIIAEKTVDGRKQPRDGELWHRGKRACNFSSEPFYLYAVTRLSKERMVTYGGQEQESREVR